MKGKSLVYFIYPLRRLFWRPILLSGSKHLGKLE